MGEPPETGAFLVWDRKTDGTRICSIPPQTVLLFEMGHPGYFVGSGVPDNVLAIIGGTFMGYPGDTGYRNAMRVTDAYGVPVVNAPTMSPGRSRSWRPPWIASVSGSPFSLR